MTEQELDAILGGIVPALKGHLAPTTKAVGALADRLGAIEKRLSDMPIPLNGKDGVDGLNGKDGAAGIDGKDGANGIDGKDGAPGADGTKGDPGERGQDGINGKDGAPGERGERGEKGEKGDAGPQGEQGPAGADGAPGIAGKDGADGINGKDGAQGIAGERGEVGPQGEKGADGLSGKDGRDGIDGKDGAPGINGKDGAAGLNGKDGAPGERGEKGIDGKSISLEEIRPILDGEVAKWALEFERRAADTLQKAIDRMPAAKDGKDGFSPEGFDLSLGEDGRTLNVTLRNGDKEITKSVRLGFPIDRGIYKVGISGQAGDGYTYGGSFYIAKRDFGPDDRPDGPAFRRAVNRGKDGSSAEWLARQSGAK